MYRLPTVHVKHYVLQTCTTVLIIKKPKANFREQIEGILIHKVTHTNNLIVFVHPNITMIVKHLLHAKEYSRD